MDNWRALNQKLGQINKIRERIGQQCPIDDLIRPVGLPRREWRKVKARLERLEREAEGLLYGILE